jgi:hypothetical protein
MPSFELVDIRNFDPVTDASDAFIIIVRYASFPLSRWIKRNRERLSGVALFVDDDIAEAITSSEASFRYRYRLLSQSILPIRLLSGLIDEIWVSTETLRQRLSYARPSIMAPAPDGAVLSTRFLSNSNIKSNSITVAYHATAIHSEEHHFLKPVIAAVLTLRPQVHFEVVAIGKSADSWLEMGNERITVKRPLPWDEYLLSQNRGIDIMVVPVAPGRLNDCRAGTKRIDIARVGAAGLLSDCLAFRPATTGEILLPYDQSSWVSHLTHLIDYPTARQNAAMATRNRVQQMAKVAELGIPSIKSQP